MDFSKVARVDRIHWLHDTFTLIRGGWQFHHTKCILVTTAVGRALEYHVCPAGNLHCFSVSECTSRWCGEEPMPPIGDTGCIDCTVCPRTF